MDSLTILRQEIEKELLGDILPFWIKKTTDTENGGFYGLISFNGKINKKAKKGCILNSRILWTFSYAYRVFQNPEYKKTADHAWEYLKNIFYDKEYSGLYWMAHYNGKIKEDRKHMYNLAFGIYGLSEYYRATGNKEALELAITLFGDIESHSFDKENLGYFEATERDWSEAKKLSLSSKDMNVAKSMNTHLHILEGYMGLCRVWKDEKVIKALKGVLEVIMDHIVDRNTWHFKLFFDEKWNCQSPVISYGHDIEGSWLILEAAVVLGDEKILERAKLFAVNMARCAVAEGADAHFGGLYEEKNVKGHIETDKTWWIQAEALVGGFNAWQMTKEQHFLDFVFSTWAFIKNKLVDKRRGEWYWKTKENGHPVAGFPKVEPWKCPYHNGRACYELLERIK